MNSNLVLCTCFALAITIQMISCIENPECKPRKVILQVGESHKLNTDQYSPAAVEVYRCSGHHEAGRRCAAIVSGITKAKFSIRHRHTKNGDFGAPYEETYENHTKCEMRCSCNSRVSKCQDTDKYAIECPKGSLWDFKECGCIGKDTKIYVGCGKGQEDDDVSISLTMFILALVIEFVIVLIAIFLIMDACKYHRRESGVFHKTAEFIRSVSNRPHEGNMTLRKDRSDTGSESFLNSYNAQNGKIDKV